MKFIKTEHDGFINVDSIECLDCVHAPSSIMQALFEHLESNGEIYQTESKSTQAFNDVYFGKKIVAKLKNGDSKVVKSFRSFEDSKAKLCLFGLVAKLNGETLKEFAFCSKDFKTADEARQYISDFVKECVAEKISFAAKQ